MKYGPWFLVLVASAAWAEPYDFEPIRYESTPARDAVTRLQKRIGAGEVELRFDATRGYLAAVLAELDIPVSSQGLVFSKTSFQPKHISPATPRAVYFSDDVYVGWVQGGDVIEISAVDPNLGAVFYTLDQRPQPTPRFVRRTQDCLQCHTSALAQSVPGHLVRSVYADAEGHPLLRAGASVSDHRTPLDRRWGGWYVTGTHGAQSHLGNLIFASDTGSGIPEVAGAKGGNVLDLRSRFEVAPYLSGHSDIVARMVLDHQAHMHNLITRAAYRTRIALHEAASFAGESEKDVDPLSPVVQRRVVRAGEPLVRYLLMTGQTPLTATVRGSSRFTADFQARGPRDSRGRSLRDLDLQTRLFRYPCSYLIYSQAFDQLPQPMLDYVYRRLGEILTGKDRSETFAALTAEDRRAILEILRDTKASLPPALKKK